VIGWGLQYVSMQRRVQSWLTWASEAVWTVSICSTIEPLLSIITQLLCCVVPAVGIDLGTTYSVVGASIGGKVTIIEDKAGHKIFPSVVAYLDDGGTNSRGYAYVHPLKRMLTVTLYSEANIVWSFTSFERIASENDFQRQTIHRQKVREALFCARCGS
jgi:hypothetical protein